MAKTIIPIFKGWLFQKLLKKLYIKITTKKSPNVWRINPVFRKIAIEVPIAKISRNKRKYVLLNFIIIKEASTPVDSQVLAKLVFGFIHYSSQFFARRTLLKLKSRIVRCYQLTVRNFPVE